MKSKRRVATSRRWQAADHKFAVATVALMIFLLLAGLTNWLLDGGQTVAAADRLSTRTTAGH
jgi:hypothetical protein